MGHAAGAKARSVWLAACGTTEVVPCYKTISIPYARLPAFQCQDFPSCIAVPRLSFVHFNSYSYLVAFLFMLFPFHTYADLEISAGVARTIDLHA
jgi:hypothetical protein